MSIEERRAHAANDNPRVIVTDDTISTMIVPCSVVPGLPEPCSSSHPKTLLKSVTYRASRLEEVWHTLFTSRQDTLQGT
jgi:hypothetical protein